MEQPASSENAVFWVETTDEKTGKTYYYHSVTFVAVWERPKDGLIVPESELIDETDGEGEYAGATGGAPPPGAAQSSDAVTAKPESSKASATAPSLPTSFTSPIISGSTGPLPHSPIVTGPAADDAALSPTPPNSSPPSRAASTHFLRSDGRSHPTVDISNPNSVDASPDRAGNHKMSTPLSALSSPRDPRPSTPVPRDLPTALSRIAELEDSEYRLKIALQEAMAAIEMKNKVLEDTAQYVETLEAELQAAQAVLSASADSDAIAGMSSPEVLDPPTSGTLIATVLEGRGVGVVVADHSAATAAIMTPHPAKLSSSKSSPALHSGSDGSGAHRNPYVKLRLSGQGPEWRATKSARGGGIDPKWPLLLDAVQSFPFNFRPTAAFRQLFLEVEVWNEDLEGVDSLMGTGQLDVTNFTKWTCPDSAPLQIDLQTPSGAAAGIIYVRMRSEVKASGPGIVSTLSPETQAQLSFLKSVSLFHSFSEEQLIGLTRKVVIRSFEPGSVIVKQGDIGHEFFIVHSGRVSVRKKLEKRSRAPGEDRASSGGSISIPLRHRSVDHARATSASMDSVSDDDSIDAEKKGEEYWARVEVKYGDVVADLNPGFFFGETALLGDSPRASTCIASTHVECWVLTRADFTSTMGQVEHYIAAYCRRQREGESAEALGFARHISAFSAYLASIRSETDTKGPSVAVPPPLLPPSRVMIRMVSMIAPELSLSALLDKVIKESKLYINVHDAAIYLFDEPRRVFTLRRCEEYLGVAGSEAGVVLHVGLTGETFLSQDTDADERFHMSADGWGVKVDQMDNRWSFRTRNMLALPIYSRDREPLGVLQFLNKVRRADELRERTTSAGAPPVAPPLPDPPLDPDLVAKFTPPNEPWRFFNERDEAVGLAIADMLGTIMDDRMAEFELALGGPRGQRHIPLSQVNQPYKITISGARRVKLPKKKQLAQCFVSAYLYHGSQELCAPVQTDNAPLTPEDKSTMLTGSTMWQQRLAFRIQCRDMPVATRIVFNVSTKDGPVGWAGLNLFTYQRQLKSGAVVLKMWPGDCTAEMAASFTSLSNQSAAEETTGELIVNLHQLQKTAIAVDAGDAMQVHIGEDGTTFEESEDRVFVAPTSIALQAQLTDVELQSALDRIGMLCSNDPLYELNYDERALFWKARRHLMATPEALPWFLQSVSWDDVACVSEARKLMSKWEKPSPMLALQLLDIKFPDPSVRAYAVSCLEELDNKSLRQIMLQLTQVLKFEPFQDSALSRFLLRRAVRNPRDVGHVFFWLLQAEMHMKEVSERYGAMLEQYLRNCGDYRTELGHQMFVMSRLEQTAYKVKTGGSKEERLSILSQELQSIVFPREFQLPLSPDMVASGLVLSPMKCRVMSSKKLPLWLVFKSVRDPGTTHTVLFKAGDDLRQDQLTLQILNIMDNLWKERGLDLRMSPYMCVSTGNELGMLQVVLNAETLAGIVVDSVTSSGGSGGFGRKLQAASNVLKDNVIHRWLKKQPGNEHNMEAVYDNFARSCAGYCVATYVLGIGDRHNDNIMLTRDGRLFHIDFGHFLGNFKSKLGVKRERAPFVFTPHFSDVLDGPGSDRFKLFESYCVQAYNILRHNGNLLITLFFLMLSSGIPELQHASDLTWLQDKLMMHVTDEIAADSFRKLIIESLHTKTTLFNDFMHLLKHA